MSGLSFVGPGTNDSVSGVDLSDEQAAWTILYGTPVNPPGTFDLIVKWRRPLDGMELTDVAGMFVEPPGSNLFGGEGRTQGN